MSTTFPSPIGALLADHGFRGRIVAMIRRHVPAADVQDVAQSVFCEALAADAVPASPAGFLYGIARHKIADLHRAKRRAPELDADIARRADREPPLEARSLLSAVVAHTSARDGETLAVIARAADGERIDHMAEQASMSAESLRQRIARLRQSLRTRWSAELLVLAVAFGAQVLWGVRHDDDARPNTAAITSDAASVPAELLGTWRVVAGDRPAGTIVRVEKDAIVTGDGARVRVRGAKRADGAFDLVFDTKGNHRATARMSEGALHVRGEMGSLVLIRHAPTR